MNRKTYNKSVDILLDAYNEGKLFHGKCNACAVGNLLGTEMWRYQFCTINGKQKQITATKYKQYNKLELEREKHGWLKLTVSEIEKRLSNLYKDKGYTQEELKDIEYAFEAAVWDSADANVYENYRYYNQKEGQYLGLVAVLKVMETMIEDEPVTDQVDIHRLQDIAVNKYHVDITQKVIV